MTTGEGVTDRHADGDARDGGDDYEHSLAHEAEHPGAVRERPLVQVRRDEDPGDGDWSYAMAHDVPRPDAGDQRSTAPHGEP